MLLPQEVGLVIMVCLVFFILLAGAGAFGYAVITSLTAGLLYLDRLDLGWAWWGWAWVEGLLIATWWAHRRARPEPSLRAPAF